jgi:acetolactate synthase I/II/III large subunit
MKLSDYVFRFIAAQGIRHVFVVPGGGAMHLNDSAGHTPGIECVFTLHEQAAAMAAETYAKYNENLGLALVTSGPGGTNAITGAAGAWLDSTPCLFISGQVKRDDLSTKTGVRQLGVQELDIVTVVRSITKYAMTVTDPTRIRYHLEEAIYTATHGRPGPVWLDVPLDVQAAQIDVGSLEGFDPHEVEPDNLAAKVEQTIELLNASERPVVLIGNGVRLSHGQSEMRELVECLGVPILLTWLAHDLVPETDELLVGRPGPLAPRGANFTLQNSDWLLSIGARLDLVVTGYSHAGFARAATKIMVDVDAAEIRKMKMAIRVPVCADARAFMQEMLRQRDRIQPRLRPDWRLRCRDWKARYPVVLPEYFGQERVSTYVLGDVLSNELTSDDVIVSGSSGAGIEIFLLAFRAREGQRVLLTTALGAMGYGLPASIGACLASGGKRTTLVDGDGSFQLNIQELETLARLRLPVKIFVLNNQGYASIRTSQSRYFGRLTGADASSGLTLPDLGRLAEAYGLPFAKICSQDSLTQQVQGVLNTPGPIVCEVLTPPDEQRAPSMVSVQRADGSMVSKPLEDLWPFLDRKEFLSNMVIPVLEESWPA